MNTSKQGLLADRDAIQDIVARLGLSGTVRLLAQVTASNARYYQVTDHPMRHGWDVAQDYLDAASDDIAWVMRREA